MANPVELIVKSQKRRARLAALGAGLVVVLPIVVTLALAFGIEWVSGLIFDRFGYLMAPHTAILMRKVLIGFAGAEVVVIAGFAWLEWSRANDFVGTAGQIDSIIGANQEILTLAMLSDPARPQAQEMRTPLFPLLWRRAISYLDPFDPRREFRFRILEPLKRSSACATAVAAVLGLSMIALMRQPTPTQAVAHRLRLLADSIDAAENPDVDQQMAAAARDVARDLENPKLPPEQKLAELESLKQQLEKYQQQQSGQSGSGNSSGSSGSGNGKGNGTGQGEGSGNGAGGSGNGSGAGGGGNAKGKKSDQQTVELHNDIKKAEAKLEEQSNSGKTQTAQNQNKSGSGIAPKPGTDPNRTGARDKAGGTGNLEIQQPEKLAQGAKTEGSNPGTRKDDKGSRGDTHLGEIPKPVAFERFYKLGEKGPPIDIRDARYVTFRLPTEIASGNSEGKLVRDASHPNAAAAYTNAPLREQRLTAAPDEQQLIPPRYRGLIQ